MREAPAGACLLVAERNEDLFNGKGMKKISAKEVLLAIFRRQCDREEEQRKGMVAVGIRNGMPWGIDFGISMWRDVN